MKSFRLYSKNHPEYKKFSANDKMSKWLLDNHLSPTYTEISVFLIFLVLIFTLFDLIVLSTDLSFSRQLQLILLQDWEILGFLSFLMLSGGGYSAYYSFNFHKTPLKAHATLMVSFAVFMEVVAAIMLFLNFTGDGRVTFVLGFVNVLHAFALLIALNNKAIDETALKPVQGKPIELFTGIIFVVVMFFVMRYQFLISLPIVFSACISYVLIFNEMISQIFVKR